MMFRFLKIFAACSFTISLVGNVWANRSPKPKKKAVVLYACSPCGYDCDGHTYIRPGTCAICHMPLVRKSTITFKNIKPSEIASYLNAHPNAVLLDVRTKEEFNGKADPNFGTLKNAINVPVQELQNSLASLDSLKNRQIIVYCSHAHRSAVASYLLTTNGFHKVINMSGGVSVMTDSSYKKVFR